MSNLSFLSVTCSFGFGEPVCWRRADETNVLGDMLCRSWRGRAARLWRHADWTGRETWRINVRNSEGEGVVIMDARYLEMEQEFKKPWHEIGSRGKDEQSEE